MTDLLEFIFANEEAFKSARRGWGLFSDFSAQAGINSVSFTANADAWKQALAHAAIAGLIPNQSGVRSLLSIQTGDQLLTALAHKDYGRPLGLYVVFEDAVSKHEMIPLNDFLSSRTSIYQSSWSISPVNAFKWGLRKLGVLGEPNVGRKGKLEIANFVVVTNVETAAELVLKHVSHLSGVDLLFSRIRFLKELGNVLNPALSFSGTDVDVLFVYLSRDKQVASSDGQTIKFKSYTETRPEPINDHDTAISNLRDLIDKLESQIPALDQKIAEMDASARIMVGNKQMNAAKQALRSKKMLVSALVKRTATLNSLQSTYAGLEQAVSQVEIFSAIKASSAALKGLNNQMGSPEVVQGVVDELNNQMANVDEVSGILNGTGQPVDETEIEAELTALQSFETAAALGQLEPAQKGLKTLPEPEMMDIDPVLESKEKERPLLA
ncbi:hypothetical protein GQ43DRAFT_441890 [Delitschia confertaspora ATCC 74209]|uniref:SNF7 family protein n=1 Tax=Delitschia confertaspora ATCC 74209 TaxID=1513339 RepID=A0A9P4MRM0_9PLEO|nr:hypothetical protein GQ43DRAFT_441890 [Delitschia confertaspora ATCC 74209]